MPTVILDGIVPNSFDGDTCQVIAIALTFLEKYFRHGKEESLLLAQRFFAKFSERFDEDAVHHESAYRLAAAIQYLSFLEGEPSKLGDWMIANGYNKPPSEALEYFREQYFAK